MGQILYWSKLEPGILKTKTMNEPTRQRGPPSVRCVQNRCTYQMWRDTQTVPKPFGGFCKISVRETLTRSFAEIQIFSCTYPEQSRGNKPHMGSSHVQQKLLITFWWNAVLETLLWSTPTGFRIYMCLVTHKPFTAESRRAAWFSRHSEP
jgi:hypothetical protein